MSDEQCGAALCGALCGALCLGLLAADSDKDRRGLVAEDAGPPEAAPVRRPPAPAPAPTPFDQFPVAQAAPLPMPPPSPYYAAYPQPPMPPAPQPQYYAAYPQPPMPPAPQPQYYAAYPQTAEPPEQCAPDEPGAFWCPACKHFIQKAHLDRHNSSKKHLNAVARV